MGGLDRFFLHASYIPEYTVQRHLQYAFEKVGVKSRRELLKRLFFRNILPGMRADQSPEPGF